MEPLIGEESWLRAGALLAAFGLLALAEGLLPRRRRQFSRRLRWPHHLALGLLDLLLVRALFPAAAVGVALLAEANGLGLLRLLEAPPAVAVLLSVLALDLAVYFQHVLLHAVPVLWRLHRVHHADPDLDLTTGLRFHPLEILLSMLWKSAVIVALGAPALAVLVFETLLAACSLFNHANLGLPSRLERPLRLFLVTPDMHRVHHSANPQEADTNFGSTVPWWDRLFGTYRCDPRAGHEAMVLGIGRFDSALEQRLDRLLLQPLRGEAGGRRLARRRPALH
ncbi:MAG TPA: sterol desaturase family protein [Burkholderiales bacterium]|nr:sterol desaturase family protein [Burkholderiales bacterium]